MTVERPNVESADKIEAVDKLSRGIGVRQGTKWGVDGDGKYSKVSPA